MRQRRWVRWACVALVGTVVLGAGATVVGASAVGELAKRLPEGALGFVATSGGDALKGDFQKTALGRIWNDPGVRSFYDSLKTELLAKLKQQAKDPNAPQKADLVARYAQLILSRPLLVGVAQVEVKKGPPVCAFAILDAGDRKAEVAAAVSKLEAMAAEGGIVETEVGTLKMRGLKDDDVPLSWGWVENYFVVALNDAQNIVTKHVASPRSAAGGYLDKVPAQDDALVAWFDYQKLGQFMDATIRQEGGEKDAQKFKALYQGTGWSQIRTLAARIGFAGPDVVSQALIELPTPPTGIFAAYKPIDLAWLGAVDVRAVTASAINWDLAGLYDTIMNLVKTVTPEQEYLEVRQAIIDFESEAKLRIREGLLASLAGPALFYTLPAGPMVEAPRGGFVVVARLKDVPLFEKTLSALGEFAGAKAKEMLQISERQREDGRTVHVWSVPALAMMGLMPAWSVANDHVVIGSTVELCDLGAKQLVSKGADGKSLLDAEGYKKIAAELPKSLVMLTYTDSQAQLHQTMMQLQQFWPAATMVAMQAGVKLPVLLPSLEGVAQDLGPSCRYQSFGPEGLRVYYRGPGIEAGPVAIAGAGLAAGIAMPALARTRDLAFRKTSAANLSAIGKACLIYANDHEDKLPPDLQTLVKETALPEAALESRRKPKDFDGPSYIYLPGQNVSMYPGNVVAYENPEFGEGGINVLFLDSHIEFMKPDEFRRELKETCERLGREMPEIKFQGEREVKPRGPRPPRPGKAT